MTDFSHWGFFELDDAAGSYTVKAKTETATATALASCPPVVLTGAGDVLVHRACTPEPERECMVAIVIGREHGVLTREQVAKMMRAWDMAVELAKGHDEAIVLQPVPQSWTYPRDEYLLAEEWKALRA